MSENVVKYISITKVVLIFLYLGSDNVEEKVKLSMLCQIYGKNAN